MEQIVKIILLGFLTVVLIITGASIISGLYEIKKIKKENKNEDRTN